MFFGNIKNLLTIFGSRHELVVVESLIFEEILSKLMIASSRKITGRQLTLARFLYFATFAGGGGGVCVWGGAPLAFEN